MQSAECANEFRAIFDRFLTVRSCEHGPEVEARYNDSETLRYQMCRKCWEHKEYHEISKDHVQAIRPNQLNVNYAKCLRCGLGTESCGCVV